MILVQKGMETSDAINNDNRQEEHEKVLRIDLRRVVRCGGAAQCLGDNQGGRRVEDELAQTGDGDAAERHHQSDQEEGGNPRAAELENLESNDAPEVGEKLPPKGCQPDILESGTQGALEFVARKVRGVFKQGVASRAKGHTRHSNIADNPGGHNCNKYED